MYHVKDPWVPLLWNTHSIYGEYSDPLSAARLHATVKPDRCRDSTTVTVARRARSMVNLHANFHERA
ncbi:hypothetical protein J6345_21115, partial [Burkholderia pseudomallei]|nr:hypothetical protein [Burkholderia pseudomallei]